MDPRIAQLETLLTAFATRRHDVDLVEMLANSHLGLLVLCRYSLCDRRTCRLCPRLEIEYFLDDDQRGTI